MPRYHFNLHDGHAFPDLAGHVCADLQAARIEAVRSFGGMLSDEAARFWDGHEWTMEVTDAEALVLFRLTFLASDAPAALRRPANEH